MLTKKNLLVTLGTIGLAISTYLAYVKLFNSPIYCGISNGCDTVQNSKYALMFGIPLGAWGMAYYAVLIYLSLTEKQRTLQHVTVIWGLIFSIYLTSLEAFVIHAYCKWCLASAAITILISLVHFLKKR